MMLPCHVCDDCRTHGEKKALPCKEVQKPEDPPLHQQSEGREEDERRHDTVYLGSYW